MNSKCPCPLCRACLARALENATDSPGAESIEAQFTEWLEPLHGLVHNLHVDPSLEEDLLQEAVVHYWCEQSRHPGCPSSWYRQSCFFHLQHLQAHGRSVDSPKHRHDRLPFPDQPESNDSLQGPPEQPSRDELLFENIVARDLETALSAHLVAEVDRTILHDLADGFEVNEIAHNHGWCHQFVTKHRKKIQAAAIKWHIFSAPPPTRIRRKHS